MKSVIPVTQIKKGINTFQYPSLLTKIEQIQFIALWSARDIPSLEGRFWLGH
jgi:hypothetical protein